MSNIYSQDGKLKKCKYVIKEIPFKFTMLGSEKDFFEALRHICDNYGGKNCTITVEVIEKDEKSK